MAIRVLVVVLAALIVLSGCMSVGPDNPAFLLDRAEARDDLKRMRGEAIELDRPVLVLNGWRSPTIFGHTLASTVRELTGGSREEFLAVSYPLAGTIEAAAAKAVEGVERRWPSDDPEATIEVDVVGMSMGGLVARQAALPVEGRKRLTIRRLYTLNSPHRGARLARLVAIDPASWDMKPGSGLLASLDAAERSYEIIAYTQINDTWVGARHASPTGEHPIWANGSAILSHFTIRLNPQIMADLARRLRGEEPIATPSEPPSE